MSDKQLQPWVGGFTVCVDVFDVEWRPEFRGEEVREIITDNLLGTNLSLRSFGGPYVNGVMSFEFEFNEALDRDGLNRAPYSLLTAFLAVEKVKIALEKDRNLDEEA